MARLPQPPEARVTAARAALSAHVGRLQALSPLAILGRGYGIVRGPDQRILTDATAVEVGDELHLRLHGGSLEATVGAVHADEGGS